MTTPTLTEVRPTFYPTTPEKMEDTGVSEGLLLDLMVRRLSLEGTANLAGLGEKLKLSYPVVDRLFRTMREHHLVEVKGMLGNDYWITLSGQGRTLASERLLISKYAGDDQAGKSTTRADIDPGARGGRKIDELKGIGDVPRPQVRNRRR